MPRPQLLTAALLLSSASVALSASLSLADPLNFWPTEPDVQTVNGLSVETIANRGISGSRVNYQSFTITESFTLGTIYLSAANYSATGTDFSITFHSIATPNSTTASLWTSAPQIGETITITSRPETGQTGNLNLRVDLAPTEQIHFDILTGTGYIIAIRSLNTNGGGAAFNWVHSNTSSDLYSGGRSRRDDGTMTNTRDYGVALVAATPIPEPSAFAALAGLVALSGAALRRRR